MSDSPSGLAAAIGVRVKERRTMLRWTLDRLAAVGSGDPAPMHSYDGPEHQTFDGRARAVVRSTGRGAVTVTVSAGDVIAPATVVLEGVGLGAGAGS